MTISLCMIVKNEEDVLARCLDSVRDAVDEIIIVDTGSTDGTRAIARRYTPHVLDFPWIDDFSAARNASFAAATGDFLLWLDADDVLPPEELPKLLALKARLTPATGTVMLPYHVAFDSEGRTTLQYYRERLVQRALHPRWKGAVHEVIEAVGRVEYGEVAIRHKKLHPSDPDRNLRIFEKQLALGQPLPPREQYYYGRELCDHGRWQEAIAVFRAFLREPGAWIENRLGAHLDLAHCYRALGQPGEALAALAASLALGEPRAEVCCRMGDLFLEARNLRAAIFWYEAATRLPEDGRAGGFVQPEFSGYRPLMQLCLCYDRLGDPDLAQRYNERAGALKPNDPSYLYNRDYFARILPTPDGASTDPKRNG